MHMKGTSLSATAPIRFDAAKQDESGQHGHDDAGYPRSMPNAASSAPRCCSTAPCCRCRIRPARQTAQMPRRASASGGRGHS